MNPRRGRSHCSVLVKRLHHRSTRVLQSTRHTRSTNKRSTRRAYIPQGSSTVECLSSEISVPLSQARPRGNSLCGRELKNTSACVFRLPVVKSSCNSVGAAHRACTETETAERTRPRRARTAETRLEHMHARAEVATCAIAGTPRFGPRTSGGRRASGSSPCPVLGDASRVDTARAAGRSARRWCRRPRARRRERARTRVHEGVESAREQRGPRAA